MKRYPSIESTIEQADRQMSIYKSSVYGCIAISFIISGVMSWLVSTTPMILQMLFTFDTLNNLLLSRLSWYLIMGQLALLGILAVMFQRLSSNIAIILFVLCSILTGLNVTILFIENITVRPIAYIFFILASIFIALACYSYLVKRDLSVLGCFIFMSFIGIIITLIANIFIPSDRVIRDTTYISIVVFAGFTAYNIKNLRALSKQLLVNDKNGLKHLVILGALTLYCSKSLIAKKVENKKTDKNNLKKWHKPPFTL